MGIFKNFFPIFLKDDGVSTPLGAEFEYKIQQIRRLYELYYMGGNIGSRIETDAEAMPDTVCRSKRIKRLIDKQADFMVGNTPDLKVSCLDTEVGCENAGDIQKYLNAVLKANNFSNKIIKGARDCFIGGRVFLKVNVTPEKINLAFIPADNFIFETKADDVDVLESVLIFYCTREREDRHEQRWWKQRYFMEDGKCYVSEGLYDGYANEIEGYTVLHQYTGLNNIPGVVILNEGLSGDTEGESDVLLIADEDSYYNELRSRNGDTLKANMNPLKYVIGANRSTFKGLNTAPGAVNDIQPDPTLNGTLPTVGQLENGFGFASAYEQTLDNVSSEMMDNLGIPDVSLDKLSGVITSGKGLKALYWSLICRCNGKWTTWKPALEQMARLIIDAAEVFPALKNTYGNFKKEVYVVDVEPSYALPDDEETERENDLKEVGTARSVKSYLMKWGGTDHNGLTDEQADKEIEQMVREKRMMEESYEGNLSDLDDLED